MTVRKDSKGRNLRPGESQRKDGRYVYYYELGTKRKCLYDTDLASLRARARKIEKDKDDEIRTQEACRITLNDMFKVYMQTKVNLKKSTYANYMYLWSHYIEKESLSNRPINTVKRSDIMRLYTKLLKNGFASNSLDSINNLIHPTFEMAVDDDYIRKNPSKGVYRSLKQDDMKPRISLTVQQEKAFLKEAATNSTYTHWYPLFVTLLGTGMRVAECCGLTWEDVDFERKTISINHSLIYRMIDGKAGFHITTTKTKNGVRYIPLLPEVEVQLKKLYETKDEIYDVPQPIIDGYTNFVFRNRFGDACCAHNINRAIVRIYRDYNLKEMDQAELEEREPQLLPHFSVHCLRHTFCTRLCEQGINLKILQQIMGHADISTTMDIYTHIGQDSMQKTLGEMAGRIGLI